MGLFGNDNEQDARLDALETHVRALSESVQRNQLDATNLHLKLIGLQTKIDDKLSAEDFDPALRSINEQMAVARGEIEKASAAASESWSMVHAGASDALNTLRDSVEKAAARMGQEVADQMPDSDEED
jgi:hypothetical protein